MLTATAVELAAHQLSIPPPPLSVSLSPDQVRILNGIRAGERRAIDEAGYSPVDHEYNYRVSPSGKHGLRNIARS